MRSGCVRGGGGGESMSGVTFCALLWSEIFFFCFVYFTGRINVSNAY